VFAQWNSNNSADSVVWQWNSTGDAGQCPTKLGVRDGITLPPSHVLLERSVSEARAHVMNGWLLQLLDVAISACASYCFKSKPCGGWQSTPCEIPAGS
jgi:hypothetical protein